MVRVGVDSIPVVFLTTMFTGMVLSLQTYQGFQRVHAEHSAHQRQVHGRHRQAELGVGEEQRVAGETLGRIAALARHVIDPDHLTDADQDADRCGQPDRRCSGTMHRWPRCAGVPSPA